MQSMLCFHHISASATMWFFYSSLVTLHSITILEMWTKLAVKGQCRDDILFLTFHYLSIRNESAGGLSLLDEHRRPHAAGNHRTHTRELDSRKFSGTQQECTELVPLMRSVFWTLFDDIYTSFTDSGHAATTHAPHTTILPRMAPSHHSRSCRETRAPAFPREHARVERTPTDAPG